MNKTLDIRPAGALDFLSLGAIPFRNATECRIHVSGGEYNVAANLADCIRPKSAVATAMADILE